MVRLSTTRPALIVVTSSCCGHPLRGRTGPRATSFRLLSCLPTALRCQMDETGTSVRHRFIGSFRTNHCLPSSTYMGCRTLTTMAVENLSAENTIFVRHRWSGTPVPLLRPRPLAERHASALQRCPLFDHRRPELPQLRKRSEEARHSGSGPLCEKAASSGLVHCKRDGVRGATDLQGSRGVHERALGYGTQRG